MNGTTRRACVRLFASSPRRLSLVGVLVSCAALATATGCTPTTMAVTGCPNPVLLGPVDRVGGHRAAPAKAISSIDVEVADFAEASSSTDGYARTTTARATSSGTQHVGLAAIEKTEGRPDRDVHVKAIPVGAWGYLLAGGNQSAAAASAWVGVRADVVEVRRGQ